MWNDALPRNGITNWSAFYPQPTGTLTNGWLSWMKPAGVSWVYVFAIGSGGAGGTPANGATTVGGGGGSSGSVTRMLIPASLLPDILYLRPGQQATNSYICIAPNTTAQNIILIMGAGGSGSATGTGGTATGASTSASGIWVNVGLFTSIAGQAGGAGASLLNANGSSVAFGASGLPVTGGAGGGNGTGAGGDVTGAGLMPTVTGGVGTTGGNGQNGFRQGQTFAPGFKLFPLLFGGGSGGGGNLLGTAGNGGNGAWGCGGGGGGSASGTGTSGNGGAGGGSLILIGAF